MNKTPNQISRHAPGYASLVAGPLTRPARSLRAAVVALAVVAVGSLGSAACDNYFRGKVEGQLPSIPDGLNGDGGGAPTISIQGLGVGAACGETEDGLALCRQGLTCVNDKCRAVGTTLEGQPCILSDECASGGVCDSYGVCRSSGQGSLGQVCAGPLDCGGDLACHYRGSIGSCGSTGAGDLEAPCGSIADCLPGLFCGPDGTCRTADPYFGFAPWGGTVCPAMTSDTEGPRVLFEVQRDEETPFYHLPYPNDLRATASGVDLTGFVVPGTGLVGVDLVQHLKDAAEVTQTGFSRTPVIRFRFSHTVDFGTIEGGGGDDVLPTLHYVNVDLESSGYGSGPGFSWYVTDGGGHYLCPRWLALKTNQHSPLLPNTTYAAFLTDGVRTPDGVLLTQDDEFTAMMGEEEPESPTLAAAWQQYEPLRAYLDSHDLLRENVIAGALFTTGGALDVLTDLRAATSSAGEGAETTFTPCDEAGPCAQQLTGGCPADDPGFHELHGRLSLPRVQEGGAPFSAGEAEGGLSLDDEGKPQTTGTTDVCVSLAIPAGVSMPAGGWPVVLYGHDFDGDFRAAVDELGDVLWDGGAAGPAPVAVVGWQGPLHGDRGASDQAPLSEAYALDNPDGIRGNIYQGASDIFAMVSAIEGWSIPAEESPTDTTIQFNMDRLAYMGHGHGATIGVTAVPYEPRVQLSVWAGAGADLPTMLMERTSPVAASEGMALALGEFSTQGPGELDDLHPVVNLLRDFLGPVDPQSHARSLVKAPVEGSAPKHQIQIMGLDDSHVSADASKLLARIIGLDVVPPELSPVSGLSVAEGAVSANKGAEATPVTAGLIQSNPVDGEGHFVHFQDPVTRWKLREAIRTWATDGVPVIPDGDEAP